MEIYNKVLVIIAVILVFVVIINVGTKSPLTGHASDTGKANLSIEAAASISFVFNTTDWGVGYVNEADTEAYLDTDAGTVVGGTWTPVTQPLVVSNDGNTNVSLNFSTSNIASAFIGGNSPAYQLKLENNGTGTCDSNNLSLSSFTEATGATELEGCKEMGYQNTMDTLNLHVNLTIPEDATIGTKSSIITAIATAVSS